MLIYCVSINLPGDLTFDLLTLKLVCFIAHGVGNLPTNFGLSVTFHSRLMGQHLLVAPRVIATLTFEAFVLDTGLRDPSMYQVLSS